MSEMKPVEVADTAFAVAILGGDERERVLRAISSRATPDAALPRFSSRQLVTLTWAHARVSMRPEQLGAWIAQIQAAHEKQPLLAQDQRNLVAALDRFGESAEWLSPPPKADDEATAAE